MTKSLLWLVLTLACTAVGLSGGWYAARQTTPAGGGARPEKGERDHHDEDADGGNGKEEHHEGEVHLSEQALQNMGVTVREVSVSSFTRHTAIPARIEDPPTSTQPVYAPVSGRILGIETVQGAIVENGAVIATILRDALPLPALILTEDIFKPANEALHTSTGEARRAVRNVELIQTELKRLEEFAETGTQQGLPIVPRKNIIDLRYELARAEKDLGNARSELRRHGLNDVQISEIEAGNPTPAIGQRVWRQALEQNGLWTPDAQALHDALPEDLRDLPWVVSVIGELVASSRATTEFAEWLREHPDAGRHFMSIGALLQLGSTLKEIQFLHSVDALGPVVRVKVPVAPDGPDWDVMEVCVKPGERVEAGARLAVLRNPRRLLLKAEAAGRDASALIACLESGRVLEAHPLVPGSGPDLADLKVLYLGNDESDRGTVGTVPVPNQPLTVRDEADRGRFRTWALRSGQRYLLRVPLETIEGAIVLPGDAIAEEGPDRIVFVQDGDGFKEARVVVLYQDSEVAVLDGKRSELHEGDRVVEHGAFALGLALKAGTGAPVDAHAGHNH